MVTVKKVQGVCYLMENRSSWKQIEEGMTFSVNNSNMHYVIITSEDGRCTIEMDGGRIVFLKEKMVVDINKLGSSEVMSYKINHFIFFLSNIKCLFTFAPPKMDTGFRIPDTGMEFGYWN